MQSNLRSKKPSTGHDSVRSSSVSKSLGSLQNGKRSNIQPKDIDENSDEEIEKRTDAPISDRIKDAAMHVLRSSRSRPVSTKKSDTANPSTFPVRKSSSGVEDHVKSSASSVTVPTATKTAVSIAPTSAFQPTKTQPKSVSMSIPHSNKLKDSKVSVRERQRAYDEQVRKKNWRPLSIERSNQEPQQLQKNDEELMRAVHREIFFPTNFGLPEDNNFFQPKKTSEIDTFSETRDSNEENIPSSNLARESLTINTNFDLPRKEKPILTSNVTYVPARRTTKPLPALLRSSIDNNRKSFSKPKNVEQSATVPNKKTKKLEATKQKSNKKKGKKVKGKSANKKLSSKSLLVPNNRYDIDDNIHHLELPPYNLDDDDNVNFEYNEEEEEDDEEFGDFEFSSNENDESVNHDSDSSADSQLIEVPQIRLSLSERLNTYLSSREVSILSGSVAPVVSASDDNLKFRSSGAFTVNPSAKKVIEQALAFGSDAEGIEPKEQNLTEQQSRPPKPSKTFTKPMEPISKPPVEMRNNSNNGISKLEQMPSLPPMKTPTSTFRYDPSEDSDGVMDSTLNRLKTRGIHYRPYESDEESTGSLFREDQVRDPEFGVVQTILKKQQYQEENAKLKQQKQEEKLRLEAARKAKRSYHSQEYDDDDIYRPSVTSSVDSFYDKAIHNKERETVDVEALKEQIKREIAAEQAEAQAAEEIWEDLMSKFEVSKSPKRSISTEQTNSTATNKLGNDSENNSTNISNGRSAGDAYRLRMEIMEELRKQDELFQYTLELHELQNEMLQQQANPPLTIINKPVTTTSAVQDDKNSVAAVAKDLLETTNLNLFSTEQTIHESEQLLNLYRSLQEEQAKRAQEQLQQQHMATMYNLQTLPILQDIQQSMELLQQKQDFQQQQLLSSQQQPSFPPASQSVLPSIVRVHEAAVGTSTPSSPIKPTHKRSAMEIDTQTSPVKEKHIPTHPTFPYYHYAYPSTAQEEEMYLGHTVFPQQTRHNTHPEFEDDIYNKPTETALLKLQKVEQRQKERMAWLDHVIRMHMSTPTEAAEERVKIDALHKVELEQLRQSLRESREKAMSFQEIKPRDSSQHFSMNVSSRSDDNDIHSSDQEISDRGRSFLQLSPGDEDEDEVLLDDHHYRPPSHIHSYVTEKIDTKDYLQQHNRSGVDVQEDNDHVLTEQQYSPKGSTPPSQYSFSDEEKEYSNEKETQDGFKEDDENLAESDVYEEDFEASKSVIKSSHKGIFTQEKKPVPITQSQSMYSNDDFEMEGDESQEYTQEYTHEYTQDFTHEKDHDHTLDYIPEEDEDKETNMATSAVEASIAEEMMSMSHTQMGDESEGIIEETFQTSAPVSPEKKRELDSVIMEEEEESHNDNDMAKSTQSVLEDEDYDEYDDDFVTSRSHSRIVVPKKPLLNESITQDYSVSEFEVEEENRSVPAEVVSMTYDTNVVSKSHDVEEDKYEDTFLSVQQSHILPVPSSLPSQKEDVSSTEEEYTATFESVKVENKVEHKAESIKEVEESEKIEESLVEESKYTEFSFEGKDQTDTSANAPPLSAAVKALLQDSRLSEGNESQAEVDNFHHDEDENEDYYDDDFATDVSRTSSSHTLLQKQTLSEPTTISNKDDIQKANAENSVSSSGDYQSEEFETAEQQSGIVERTQTLFDQKDKQKNDEYSDSVVEEIESEIDEESEENDEHAEESDTDYGVSVTNNKTDEQRQVDLKEDDKEVSKADEEEEDFESDFEELSGEKEIETVAMTKLPSHESQQEEKEDEYHDDDFETAEDTHATQPPMSSTSATVPAQETQGSDTEVVEEIDEEVLSEDESEVETDAIAPPNSTATVTPIVPSDETQPGHTKFSPQVLVMDEDEDGALLLDDDESNLRQRLIRAATRSSESQIHFVSNTSPLNTVSPLTSPAPLSNTSLSPDHLNNNSQLNSSSVNLSQLPTDANNSNISNSLVSENGRTAAGAMMRMASSSSMHFDPDAQRWVGGDEVSLGGFSSSDSPSSASVSSSRQPSPKSTKPDETAAAVSDSVRDVVDKIDGDKSDDNHLNEMLIESSDESGVFLAELEDTYVPIVRKTMSFAAALPPSTTSLPAKEAAKDKKVFDDDLEAFLEGLDDDDSANNDKTVDKKEDIAEEVLSEEDFDETDAIDHTEERPVDKSETAATLIVSQSEDTFQAIHETQAYYPVATSTAAADTTSEPDKEVLVEQICDILLKRFLAEAVAATQQALLATHSQANALEDTEMLLPETHSFELDESQSFAHSSQDTSLNQSLPFISNNFNNNFNFNNNVASNAATTTATEEEDETHIVLANKLNVSQVEDSQSIVLASHLLEDDDSAQNSSTSHIVTADISADKFVGDKDATRPVSVSQQDVSQQDVSQKSVNSSLNTSVNIVASSQNELQSPLTTADEAQRHLDTLLAALDCDTLHRRLTDCVATPSQTYPSDLVSQCYRPSSVSQTLKPWQTDVFCDRVSDLLRSVSRWLCVSAHPTEPTAIACEDDELDPLLLPLFQPLASPANLKRFLRHTLSQELSGFHSLSNTHYAQRLQEHQQATVSAAVNLSHLNGLNPSNLNTSMQSLHSQLSQTLQQAQQTKPQLRHFDHVLFDHGMIAKVKRQVQRTVNAQIEQVTDALVQRLVREAIAKAT